VHVGLPYVESNGESAITTSPQKKRKIRSTQTVSLGVKNKGDRRQQIPDKDNDSVANILGLYICESNPLIMHASPPEAMIRKDNSGTLRLTIKY
jgi:hypothetical protein